MISDSRNVTPIPTDPSERLQWLLAEVVALIGQSADQEAISRLQEISSGPCWPPLAEWAREAVLFLEGCPVLGEDAPVEAVRELRQRKMEVVAVSFYNRVMAGLG